MFRPRHAYRSPITNRYRGKAKGCPVFNNLTEITSEMVEQHDECLECLAKLKNRTELYKTLADNNKPSNNVIKSLQRLSSSASNNRLKTCLQFLIIKVNERSITTPPANPAATTTQATTITNGCGSPGDAKIDATKDASVDKIDSNQVAGATSAFQNSITRYSAKRLKSNSHHSLSRQQQHQQLQQQRQKLNQLASPPQDQVSSTQDQVVDQTQDEHDCRTSPPLLTTTQIDENLIESLETDSNKLSSDEEKSPSIKNEEQQTEDICAQIATTTTTATTATATAKIQLSSPPMNCNASKTSKATTTTSSATTSTSSSPRQTLDHFDHDSNKLATIPSDTNYRENGRNNHIYKNNLTSSTSILRDNATTDGRQLPAAKRRKTQNSLSSDQDTSSLASWSLTSSNVDTPPSPASSVGSRSSSISGTYSDSVSSSCCCSSCSSCSASPRHSPSPTPPSSPDRHIELEEPKLKLDDEKIRTIKKRPVLFDDLFCFSEHQSVASTPTTSSGCSPGQRSTATQNSEQAGTFCNNFGGRSSGLSSANNVIHMFQAPPAFVNSLKPCNLPIKSREQTPPCVIPPPTKVDLINCAICGIRDKPPNIVRIYAQNSCTLCTEFFAKFLERPSQLYCAQDGDCLMTFDSRCKACWIKICLQKFDIDEKYRKIGEEYTPKLLSSPNVSLITIDTSVTT